MSGFTGRWWTEGGKLVEVEGYEGWEVKLVSVDGSSNYLVREENKLDWTENGNCLIKPEFNLKSRANPQSVEAQVEVIQHFPKSIEDKIISDDRLAQLSDSKKNGPDVVSIASELIKWRRLGVMLDLSALQMQDCLKRIRDGE